MPDPMQQQMNRKAVQQMGPPAPDWRQEEAYTLGGGIGPRPVVPQDRWTRPVNNPMLETGTPYDVIQRRQAAREQSDREFEDFKRRDLEEWKARNPEPHRFLGGYYHPEDAESTVAAGPSLEARQYHARSQPPMVMEGHAAKMRRFREQVQPPPGVRQIFEAGEPVDLQESQNRQAMQMNTPETQTRDHLMRLRNEAIQRGGRR